jgi:ribonuclease M5
MIRNCISSKISKDKITQIYIPDVYGKEKRKAQPSKEGKLGVEGMSSDVLIKAFQKANISFSQSENDNPVKNCDLFELGFSGTANAKQNKKKLLKAMELPEFLSTNSLLSCINSSMTKDEFYDFASKITK